jgi:hypothetical protein
MVDEYMDRDLRIQIWVKNTNLGNSFHMVVEILVKG